MAVLTICTFSTYSAFHKSKANRLGVVIALWLCIFNFFAITAAVVAIAVLISATTAGAVAILILIATGSVESTPGRT